MKILSSLTNLSGRRAVARLAAIIIIFASLMSVPRLYAGFGLLTVFGVSGEGDLSDEHNTDTQQSEIAIFARPDQKPFVGSANGKAFTLNETLKGPEVVTLKTSRPVFKAYGLTGDRSRLLYTPLKNGVPSGELCLEDLANGNSRKITSRVVLNAAFSPVNDDQIAYTYAGGETFGLALTDLNSGQDRILVTKDVFAEIVRWNDFGTGLHYFVSTTEDVDLASFYNSDDSFEAYVQWKAKDRHSAEGDPRINLIQQYVPVSQESDASENVPFGFPSLETRSMFGSLGSRQSPNKENPYGFRVAASDGRHYVRGENLLRPTPLFAEDFESGSIVPLGTGQLVETLRTGAVIKEFSPKGSQLQFVDWQGNATTLGLTAVNYNLPVKSSVVIQGGSSYAAPGNCSITSHSGAMEYAYDFQNLTVGAHALASADGLVVLTVSSASCNSSDTASCPDYSVSCGGGYFGNVVIIQHADGTYSKYAHLQTDSPQVAVGTTVNQGLYIGRQGHTGSTNGTFNGCGDHVHFQLQSSPDMFGQSVPVDFADVASEPLSCGTSYTSASNEISHSISPSSQSFGIGGGTGTVNVTSTGGTWFAISNDAWITINSGGAGTGNGTVAYSVAGNAAGLRIGTMNVGGHIFTVSQDGTQPQNQGPTVNAGNDQTITLPAAVNLNGTGSDDGLPNPPATLTTNWSKVSGPGVVTFGNANALNTTASFSLAGVYVLRLTANDSALSATDDLTVVANINNGGGTLSGSQATPPSNTNLSTQGTSDWAHWGLTNVTSFNHKNGVTQQISNFAQIGSTTPLRYTNSPISYTWSGGTPTATAANTTTGIYTYGIGNGFQVTVPADITQKTLKLYVGLWNATGRLEVSLSDGSASPYINNSMSSPDIQNGVFTLNYRAATNGQTLTLKWTEETNTNPAGNITLQAVTLAVPVNQAPVVNAGSDQFVALPASALLNGTATDDGLPNPPAAVTTTWSKVSGPGTVSFVNANSLTTTADFSIAGSYILRLTGNDSALSATDDINITVSNNSGTGLLTASGATPPANTNLATQGTADWTHWGFNAANSFNHKNGVTQQISNFTSIGTGTVQQYANNPNMYSWTGGTPTVSATNTPTGVYVMGLNNGFQLTAPADTTQRTLKVYVGLWAAGGRFEASLSDGSATTYVDTSLSNSSGTSNRVYTLNYKAGGAGQTLTVKWTVNTAFNQWSNVTVQAATLVGGSPPTNQTPSVNAGIDQTVTLPNTASLSGTASDDGLPNPPAALTTTWTKVSGTGTITFGNANSLSTTASFSTAGSYVLRLSANDSALSSSDDISITVNPAPPANQAPVVNAGSDQIVTLPANAALNGTATDDGLPNPPSVVTTTWTKLSGPGTVTFGNANSLSTTASFSTAGSYVLRLTANDSALSSSDDIWITVNPPTNHAPTVNAGIDQTVTLPTTASLSGTASDDGLPNPPATLTTTWSKVSGPGTVTFGNANSLITTASFSVAGNYVLRLTGNDSALSATDDLSITVNPAPPTNQAPSVNAGIDQTATLPNTASLSGTASDDGLPNPPSTLTTNWSKVSGPGTVTFGNGNSLNTTASFSIAGNYVLRLIANDGALSGADDISITVNNPSSGGSLSGSIAGMPTNVNLATEGTSDWAHWGLSGAGSFNHKSGVTQQISNYTPIGSGTIQQYSNNPNFYSWTGGTPTASATNTPTGIYVIGMNNGFQITVPADTTQRSLKIYVGLWAAGGKFQASLSDGSAATYTDTSTINSSGTTNGVYTLNYKAASSGQTMAVKWTVNTIFNQWSNVTLQGATLVGGAPLTNQAPAVNAGNDQTVTLPNTVSLSGITSDDGLPNPPAAVSPTWSKVGGPGTVTFGNANTLSTTASFSSAGSYVLRLTASDSALSSSDDVSITVNNSNPGDEFQVSSSLAFAQWTTHIAANQNGDFVVAWQSNLQDGSGWGIFARKYNSAGVPIGNEFQVNTYTTDNQFVPRVGIDASGNFAIVWESKFEDGSGYGIYCQRYNAAGVPIGSEFRVNTTTTDNQHDPFIAMAPSGNFVVVWASDLQDGSLTGIYGQRFDASGNAVGGEFPVNTYRNDEQKQACAAMDANGNFVVVYESTGQDGSGRGVYARRFNAAGVPQGNEFQVNTFTTNDQSDTWVAMDPLGDFVITWNSLGQDGSGEGVFGQRYNSAGVPQGAEFRVNSYTINDQIYSTVALDPSGNFVIVWESVGQDGSGRGVYGQRYNAAGVALGGEFQINIYTQNDQFNPFITMDGAGNSTVAWVSVGQDGFVEGVYARRYDSSGSPSFPAQSTIPSLKGSRLLGLRGPISEPPVRRFPVEK